MNLKNEKTSLHMKRLSASKRILLFAFTGIFLLVVLFMIFSPGIAKNYINKHGKELAGRTIQIKKLKYNWFTSTLRINGLRYFEKNDKDIFIACDTFMVNLNLLRLLANEINVQQLRVINPTGNFIQNDTVYNFDDLIKFFTATDSTQATEEPTEPYKLNLNNLEMKNGSVYYTDMEVNHTFKLEEVSFIIPQILWSRLDSSKADIAFKLANGGSFEGALNYNMENGNYDGYFQIGNMAVATILPYVQQEINISAMYGTASGRLDFSGMVDDYNQVKVHGNFRIDNFAMFDKNNKKVLGCEKASLSLLPSEPLRYRYFIDSIRFYKPYMYLALEDSLFNFEKMIVETTESEPVSTTEEYPLGFKVNRLIIDNGLMDFSDQTMREEFNYELSQITVDMDTLALKDEWVNINASMKLNKRGTLIAKVGLNPADPMKKISLDYVLTDFQLPDINIYSKYYAGFPILFGNMYYVNKTRIENHQLESNNQLIIRNVEMGRKSGGLYDVPIKLALFVLKDINGDITLDIPVKGDLSDPKVRIGPIIWDTFKSFMFKIVASPFKALGNLLGADAEELETINFNYSDTTLTAKQTRGLDLLLELEKKKPELQIDLRYFNDRKLEKSDAAEQVALGLYFQKYGEKVNPNSKDYLKFLKEQTGRDSLVIQDYEMLIAPPAMVDSIILQRETSRIAQTKNYLKANNDSTTIRIFGYNKDEVLNIGSRPHFEVKYILAEDAK